MLLPPVGFLFERVLVEPITEIFGPALYALYAIDVISYVAVALGERRLPAAVTSLVAGILLAGTLIVGSIALIGSFAALFLLLMALPRLDLGRELINSGQVRQSSNPGPGSHLEMRCGATSSAAISGCRRDRLARRRRPLTLNDLQQHSTGGSAVSCQPSGAWPELCLVEITQQKPWAVRALLPGG